MTHHPIVAQAFYYCIVAIVPTPQPRKPQTCNNMVDEWVHLAQDTNWQWTLVNTAVSPRRAVSEEISNDRLRRVPSCRGVAVRCAGCPASGHRTKYLPWTVQDLRTAGWVPIPRWLTFGSVSAFDDKYNREADV
jgi:hypothetical protein